MKRRPTFFALVVAGALLVCSGASFAQDVPAGSPDEVLQVSPRGPEVVNGTTGSTVIYTVVASNGSTSGNGRAPQGSRLFVNTKYLITGAEMVASGFPNSSVTSIGWRWNMPRPGAAAAPVAQSVATTGNLKVFMKDTAAAAAGLIGTFIDTNGVGYTKVIDATISITRTDTLEFFIDVPVGGPGTAPFTPTPGNGVLVIFCYQTTTPLATPLGAPTVACLNNGALLTYQSQTVNGTTGTASAFRPETRLGANGGSCNTYASQWSPPTTYPDVPAATYFQAAEWLGDTLFVQAPTTAGGGATTVHKYTLTGGWTAGVPLPATKVGGTLTKAGNKLYYIGGGATTITTGSTDVYEFNPATQGWTSLAPLPVALSGHKAVAWGDSVIFVVGGPYTGSGTNLDVHYYRIASNTWGTIAASLPAGQGRRTFAAGISGNKIIISSGFNTAFLKTTWVGTINSATSITWTAAPDVPTIYAGLSRPGGTVYGDKFYIVCGERAGAGGYYDTTHVYSISGNTWTHIINNKPIKMSNIFNAVTAKCVNDTIRVFVPGGYGNATGGGAGVGHAVFDVIDRGPGLTGVAEQVSNTAQDFRLEQNYPNPFNPSTTIRFSVPATNMVSLKIYDILGREVATLVEGQYTAGTYSYQWQARNLASGIYFYRLQAGNFSETKKLMLLK